MQEAFRTWTFDIQSIRSQIQTLRTQVCVSKFMPKIIA